MPMNKVSCDYNGIRNALESIRNGGIVIFPTDTVYGIGCDPYNQNAIEKLYQIKKRSKTKSFPVLGYSKKDLERIVKFDRISSRIVKKLWPGQLTLILPIKDKKLKKSMNLTDKIAVRIPNNKCVLSILKECKLLVGTSANISTKDSFVEPNECASSVTGYDVFVNGGKIKSLGESTIIEIVNKEIKIVRQGVISEEELFSLV